MYHLLLLEDDQSFGYILKEYLLMKDFEVTWVKSGEEALEAIEQKVFDLALLDIMLPGIDGFTVAKNIVAQHSELPFLFLSAKVLKIDQLKGFKLGAFDYITKPIDEELLVAKIRALLPRLKKTSSSSETYSIGRYIFHPNICELNFGDQSKKLTDREANLLRLLCEQQGKLLDRKIALKTLWGSTDEFSRKSMDVFISHLRKYLSADPNIKIENIHGRGFILKINTN